MELLLDVDVVFQNRFSLASSVMCACKRGNIQAVQLLLKVSRNEFSNRFKILFQMKSYPNLKS